MKDKITLATLLEEYRKQYLRVNGREPVIEKRSEFWVYINGDATRKFHLPKMIEALTNRPDFVPAPTVNLMGETTAPKKLTLTKEGEWLVIARDGKFMGYVARNGWSGKTALIDFPVGEPVITQLTGHIGLKEMEDLVKEAKSFFW